MEFIANFVLTYQKKGHYMKKLLLAVLLLSGIICSNAYTQSFTIPDANLANWMRNNGYAFAMTGNTIDSVALDLHVQNNGYIGSNVLNLSNTVAGLTVSTSAISFSPQ